MVRTLEYYDKNREHSYRRYHADPIYRLKTKLRTIRRFYAQKLKQGVKTMNHNPHQHKNTRFQ